MKFARLQVKVLPRGGKSEVVGYRDGILTIRVNAPAERGKANSELIRFLHRRLRVSPQILRGEFSRHKVLTIPDLTLSEVLKLLNIPHTSREG